MLMFFPEMILFLMNQPKTAIKMGLRGFLMIRYCVERDALRVLSNFYEQIVIYDTLAELNL